MASDEVPLVDVSGEGARLPDRARDLGACRIRLDGSMVEAVAEGYAASAEFFTLDGGRKAPFDARSNGTLNGWTLAAAGEQSTSAERPRDYEAFDVVLPRDAPLENASAEGFFTPTRDWPTDRLRSVSERVTEVAFDPLEKAVWSVLERTAGLAEGYFLGCSRDGSLSSLRYLHYGPASDRMGFYEHRDFETLALLVESSPGIEVRDPCSDRWLRVRLAEYEALLLVGELGEILSAGRLPAALHRVGIPARQEARQAIVYFSAPGFTTPLPSLRQVDDHEDARAQTVGQRLLVKFGKA